MALPGLFWDLYIYLYLPAEVVSLDTVLDSSEGVVIWVSSVVFSGIFSITHNFRTDIPSTINLPCVVAFSGKVVDSEEVKVLSIQANNDLLY